MQLHSWQSMQRRKRNMDYIKRIQELEQELEAEKRQRMDLQCKLNATKADLQRALHILKKHDSFYDD